MNNFQQEKNLEEHRSPSQRHEEEEKKETAEELTGSSSCFSFEKRNHEEKVQQQQQEEEAQSSPSSQESKKDDDDGVPCCFTYDELKWNDKPLYCPEDLVISHHNDQQQHQQQEQNGGGAVFSDRSNVQCQEAAANRADATAGISTTISSHPSCTTMTTSNTNNHHGTTTMISNIPIHAGKTALLIVDVQPEYWSSCPSVRKDFPHFEENLARTIDMARKQRAKIIWVRADYRKHHSPWLIQFERLNRGQRPDTIVELPCEPESEEFKWEDFATPEGGEAIIAKSSWSSTSNTALMDILRASAIDTVLVCGLITSVCVQHSAFGVFEAGYRTLLVHDACADRGRARHEAALALYGGYMYELITSHELADPVHGLQKAKPVWITVKDTTRQVVDVVGMKRKTPLGGDGAGAVLNVHHDIHVENRNSGKSSSSSSSSSSSIAGNATAAIMALSSSGVGEVVHICVGNNNNNKKQKVMQKVDHPEGKRVMLDNLTTTTGIHSAMVVPVQQQQQQHAVVGTVENQPGYTIHLVEDSTTTSATTTTMKQSNNDAGIVTTTTVCTCSDSPTTHIQTHQTYHSCSSHLVESSNSSSSLISPVHDPPTQAS